jgi:hypothetical protein
MQVVSASASITITPIAPTPSPLLLMNTQIAYPPEYLDHPSPQTRRLLNPILSIHCISNPPFLEQQVVLRASHRVLFMLQLPRAAGHRPSYAENRGRAIKQKHLAFLQLLTVPYRESSLEVDKNLRKVWQVAALVQSPRRPPVPWTRC